MAELFGQVFYERSMLHQPDSHMNAPTQRQSAKLKCVNSQHKSHESDILWGVAYNLSGKIRQIFVNFGEESQF